MLARHVNLTSVPDAVRDKADPGMRVVVGVSGGVDSSVAAMLLAHAGYEVSGLFMKNWDENGAGLPENSPCTAAEDMKDALHVCERLGVALDGEDFSGAYRDRVFGYFLAEHTRGRTPNPDILCNKEIKFKVFLEHALTRGADRIATGHYARTDCVDGRYRLLKARDLNKDQSYFLYTLGQRELAATIFPLGELTKTEVRRLAREAGLENHAKRDSTGICFIGERDFAGFLRHYFPALPGEMRTPEGEYIGTHQGLMFHTIGQRQGLGLGGSRGRSGEPWFVVGKNLKQNVLIVAQGHEHPLLYSTSLTATHLHWVARQAPASPVRCGAKIRYRQADQSGEVTLTGLDQCRVVFDAPQRAVTPGQSIVFYQGDECLGGGIIDEPTNHV
ncbi:MAG: tRNA-specific 2-thiouridylase [Gammaproteobacteria bacterium]|nr:MAG: tRNA-specific 2-thiouridylase [Gammaproteobacteria bacterium]TND07292.1 MAG: tRNA-specific 2-thiouridylase [Gammaproteobacteria bacterium]